MIDEKKLIERLSGTPALNKVLNGIIRIIESQPKVGEMSNDLISRSAAIAIIEKQRLLTGKQNLFVEYNLASIQEEIEKLPIVHDADND